LVISFQLFRKDKIFFKIADLPAPQIYLLEYLFFCVPFVGVVLLSGGFSFLPIFLGIFPVVFLDINLGISKQFFSFSFLPIQAFEWTVGFRKYGLSVFLLFFGGIFFAFYHVLIVPIFSLLLIMGFMSFFLEGEPHTYLLVYQKNIRQFLVHKIKISVGVWSIFWLLNFLVFLIFHAPDFWVMLFVWFFGAFVLGFCVVVKYAFYEPNTSLVRVQVFNFLIFFGFAIPFLVPLPLFLGVRFYRKAIQKLHFYME